MFPVCIGTIHPSSQRGFKTAPSKVNPHPPMSRSKLKLGHLSKIDIQFKG